MLHILGFFAILIPLWVLADIPKPASEVFFDFQDGGGWGNQGLSCLVGMLSPVFSFIGPDSATHMSEELRDASRTLPLAMIWTAAVNGALGFVAICTFVMVIGDLDEVLNSPTGYPFIQVFFNATHSKAGTSAMVAIFIIMIVFGCVTNFATSSRQLWAFVSVPPTRETRVELTARRPETKVRLAPDGCRKSGQVGTFPSTRSSSPMPSPCSSP